MASRSRFRRAVLGVLGMLAEPYDVTRVHQPNNYLPTSTASSNAMSPQLRDMTMSSTLTPYHSGGTQPLLSPLQQMDQRAPDLEPHLSVHSNSGHSLTDPSPISRRPAAGSTLENRPEHSGPRHMSGQRPPYANFDRDERSW